MTPTPEQPIQRDAAVTHLWDAVETEHNFGRPFWTICHKNWHEDDGIVGTADPAAVTCPECRRALSGKGE